MSIGLVEQPESASINPPMTVVRAIKLSLSYEIEAGRTENLPIIIVGFTLTKSEFL